MSCSNRSTGDCFVVTSHSTEKHTTVVSLDLSDLLGATTKNGNNESGKEGGRRKRRVSMSQLIIPTGHHFTFTSSTVCLLVRFFPPRPVVHNRFTRNVVRNQLVLALFMNMPKQLVFLSSSFFTFFTFPVSLKEIQTPRPFVDPLCLIRTVTQKQTNTDLLHPYTKIRAGSLFLRMLFGRLFFL